MKKTFLSLLACAAILTANETEISSSQTQNFDEIQNAQNFENSTENEISPNLVENGILASGVEPSLIASGLKFSEGPVWDEKNQRLIFSDLLGDTLYSIDKSGKLNELSY